MDNWKKYMAENEDKLSIEEVDGKVWQHVYKAAVTRKMSFIKKIKNAMEGLFRTNNMKKEGYANNRGYSKVKWAYAFVFISFIIVSCTYKVKSYAKYGDMVTFAFAKNSYFLNSEPQFNNLFNSFSRIISPSDSSSFVFIKWFKNNPEEKKIINKLKETRGVSDLAVTPVMYEFKESLFSSFLHKAFEIEITKAKPDVTKVKNTIGVLLKEKGLGAVDVQINNDSRDILFDSKTMDGERLLQGNDSVLITNNIADRLKVTSQTDTIKKPKKGLQQLKDTQWKKGLALMGEFTNALEKDGLVDNKKPYKLEIKDGAFYINDKKQTKEITDKYRKYFRNDNYTITNDGDGSTATSNTYNEHKDRSKSEAPHIDIDMPKFDATQYQKNLKLMTLLIDGLDEEGLMDKKKPYKLEVKQGELYINSKKQPTAVSDKFRKYFQSNNYALHND